MKSVFIFFGCMLIFFGINMNAFSQDIILLKTGDEIKAKVQEIDVALIKYKKFENVTGPTYSIEKSQVFMITYENGTKDIFNEQQQIPEQIITQEQPKQQEVYIIAYKKGGFVTLNGKLLSKPETRLALAGNPEALAMYNKGAKTILVGDIISWADLIFLLAANLKTIQTGAAATPAVLAVGVGGLVTAIIITVNGRHKVRKAVEIFNLNFQK